MNFIAITLAVLAVGLAADVHAQLTAGRGTAALPSGAMMPLDRSVAGATVTGTTVAMQQATGRGMAVTTPAGWRSTARSAQLVEEAGRTFIRVEEKPGEGAVWLEGSRLLNGTIELEMRGKDAVGQSFVGVAFRGLDDNTYDAVYFRPFNFATTDPERRRHAVQYHSNPDFPWAKLRSEKPDQYEKPVSPVPDPNGWFRVRVAIDGQTVRVFVNESATPTLTVTALSQPRSGMVGLWVGNGSGGDFVNLKISPTP